jgi:hypothetical protein
MGLAAIPAPGVTAHGGRYRHFIQRKGKYMRSLIPSSLLIGAALACCGAVLMADEPTGPKTQVNIFATIEEPQTDAAATTTDTTTTDTATGNKTSAPTTQNLSGRGRQASNKFTLTEGLTVFRTTHSGKSNYVVSLVNSDGDEVQTLFNKIGKYDGASGFEIKKAGDYLLNVQADGPWTFTIEQPRPENGKPSPTTITGNKADVSPFLALKKGLNVFKFDYKGEGTFAVTLVDRNGRPVEYLVNTLKAFDGSVPVKVPEDGIYFLNVNGEGDWQVDIQ